MATKKPVEKVDPSDVPIEITIEDGYVKAKHLGRMDVAELVWEQRHMDTHKKLTLRRLLKIPRQFEREAYGDQLPPERGTGGVR